MLIKIREDLWVEHTNIIDVCSKDRGNSPGTDYVLEVNYRSGKTYFVGSQTFDTSKERDKHLEEIVDRINAEHQKDRDALSGDGRFK